MFHEGNGLPLDSGKMGTAEGMRSVPMLTNKNSLTITDPPAKNMVPLKMDERTVDFKK